MTESRGPAKMTAGYRPALHSGDVRGDRPFRYGTHLFLTALGILWMVPLGWMIYVALRPVAVTQAHGYVSSTGPFNLSNFLEAWSRGGFPRYFINTVIITVPSVVLTLFASSMVAFALVRFKGRWNLVFLVLFTAGNLIPMQTISTPIFVLFRDLPLPSFLSDTGTLLNTYYAVILMEIAQQMGFCIFVFSGYMRSIPRAIGEAATVDGAGAWRRYTSIVIPLCRPATAALGILLTIWVYNDFFWPLLLLQNADKYPITNGINNLFGDHFQDLNLIAAGATIAVIPTLVMYIIFQKRIVGGLALGSTKQ